MKEYKSKKKKKSMSQLYEEYIQNIKDKIIEYKNSDITMGDIRGKILIIKIFGRSTRYMYGFYIQNQWTVNWRFSINKKIYK